MTRDTAINVFKKIHDLDCRSVHIGGGEPFLNPDGLESVLEIAKETGIQVEYVETNSSWYKDKDKACRILERLTQKGLSTMLVSISPFHNEHIPFFKVMGVMEACRQTGVSIFPWVSEFIPDIQTFDIKKIHALEEYELHFGEDYIKNIPNRYWITFGGRASNTFSKYFPQVSITELVDHHNPGCIELADTSHFHFDVYGNYIPGLCSGLSIARLDLGKPLNQEEYPILSILFLNGVRGLLRYAKEKYRFRTSKTHYGLKCELCYEIRRSLVMDHDVRSKELQPLGHYINE